MQAHNRGSIREFVRVFVSILLVNLLLPGPDWQVQAGLVSRSPVHAAMAGGLPVASVPVQLTASTVPSQGEAGVNLVYVTGSGFPSGTIPPTNVTVWFAATCGAAPLASATATGVQTLLGTTRRVQVQIPSSLTPNTYAVSLNGTTSSGTSFSSANCSSVQVIPLATLALTPNSGNPGSTVAVTISRSNAGFVQGSTVASFGAGTSVGGAANGALGPVTVVSPTSATAQVTINGNAAGGARTTLVATGSEQLLSSFTIASTANPAVLSITKTHTGSLTQGQANAAYTLTVANAAGAGPTSGAVTVTDTVPSGLTLVSLAGTGWSCVSNACTRSDALAGGASYPAITALVNVATNATSPQVNAASASGGGSATANVTDSTVITQPVGGPAILSISPNIGLPGQSFQVTITAQNTHFVQGVTQANFGSGVSVGGGLAGGFGAVQVTSPTTATAQVSISGQAVPALRTVAAQTGTENAILISGFGVNGTPVLSSLSPTSGNPGQTLTVTIHAVFTNFQQGVTQANFGAGISVGGGVSGGFGPVNVTSLTTATAQLSINSGATLGLRTPITAQTGAEVATLPNSGFLVLGPVTGAPPVVTITSPTEGAEVTSPTTVTGTVTSANLSNWILEYQASGSTIFTQFAAGTSATVSGTLDPTLLLNGIAQIRLTGVDTSGQTSSTITNVVVTRNVKVGNFTLSFNDLTIPVAGIPIQVVRTYDSRNKSSGDFGFGWSLSIKTTKADVNGILGQNWTGTVSGGLLPTYCIVPGQKYVVSVTLQDGTVYQFQAGLTPSTQCQQIVPPSSVDMAFTPIGATPANATLTAPIATGLFVSGSFPGPVQLLDLGTVAPVDPDQFILTLPTTGQRLQVSRTSGLQTITDTNNNTLTFSPAGISSSSGKSVNFARDAQNRITSITDPMGHILTYAYSASGDLTTFTDQLSNISTFTYDTAHDLVSFKDPSGNQPIRSVYDNSGRLIQVIDAFGHITNLTHNVGASTETVTDALGNPTTFIYDSAGNVIQTTDALANTTTATFDAHGNKLSETNALGKTITNTYDANNNRLTITDPLGNTTRFTYNSLNEVLTVTDPDGHLITNTYDASGNLLTATDSQGHTVTNVYNANGLPVSTTDPLGNNTKYGYDSSGNATSQTDATGTVTTYSYDSNGNRVSQSITRTTPSGPQTLTTQYQYDGLNRLLKTIFPDGSTSQTAYNAIGKTSATTDELGRVTAYQYDAQGRVTQRNYPDGTQEATAYDANGHQIQFTARSGLTTLSAFDAAGRLTSTTDSGTGGVTSTAYDAVGRVTSTTDPRGNVTQYAYDAAGRRTQITDALGHVTTFTFDGAGRQTSTTDANGHTTTYQYDTAGRQTQITFPDGTFESTSYDALGRKIAKTDAAGKATQYGYDALGRLKSVTDAAGNGTLFRYDEVGNRISQTDGNNHTTTFQYDQRRRRIGRTLPLGQTETLTYDAAGNLISRTDFNGKTTTFAYDTANRLLSKTPDPSFHASTIAYTYTASGRRATMTDSSGISTYQYDGADRLIGVTKPNGTLSYVYDLADNLISLNSGTTQVTYAYDGLNRLVSVAEPNTGTATYSYDPAGNLATVTAPNGVAHSYTYDTKNRLTNLAVNHVTTPIANYAYVLDASGHRLSVAELSGRSVNYTYDNIYRLTSETVAGASSGQNGAVGYSFDAVGNRLQRTSTLPAIPAGLSAYDANDRLTSDTYDANGNTLMSGSNTYVYDFENQLVQQGGVTIVYDGDGNRVSETSGGVTTKYLVDDLNPTGVAQVIQETTSASGSRAFVYGLERISQRRFVTSTSTFVVSFYVYDGHGSVRALTDSVGAMTDTYDYDAFGNLIASTGSTPNEFLFAGEQFDANLNLYYNRARYLNTATGRFLTMDFIEGDPQAPLSLHKYLYAGADPVSHVDPSGNEFDLGSFAIATAIYATIGALSGVLINGIANYVLGNPIFQGAGGAALFGAAALPLSIAFPLVGLVLAGLGIAGAGVTAWSVFTSGSASAGQKAGAVFLVGLSLFGAYASASSALGNGLWVNVKYPNLGTIFATRVGSMSAALEGIRGRISDFSDVLSTMPRPQQNGITIAVGIAEDAGGNLRTLIGTSEPRGYIRGPMRGLIQPGDIVVKGTGHAEADVVSYALAQGWKLIGVGATRDICPACAAEIAGAGADAATPKQ